MADSPLRRRRRLAPLALIVAALLALLLLVTDAAPLVAEKPATSAEQAAAVQELAQTARTSRATGEPVALTLDNRDLAALSAMATQGAAPARIEAKVADGTLALAASRSVWGRWVNLRAETSGTSQGMPEWRVHVGAVPLPGWLSDWAIARLQARYFGVDGGLPPLESMLRRLSVQRQSVLAQVLLPDGSLLVQAAATGTPTLDQAAVAALYCRLTEAQQVDPQSSLAQQLRRALAGVEATPAGHRTALAALALMAVDPEILPLAGEDGALARCAAMQDRVPITLQDRADWAMHWALSAALEVATNRRLGTLIGEWKELADTRPGAALVIPQEPSGFSFVDLASDRSGLFIARLLTDPETLAATRARLIAGDEEDLLPAAALKLNDGLTEAEFTARYGGLDDPRYTAKVAEIDALLRRSGIE